jgi:hypothetical protein
MGDSSSRAVVARRCAAALSGLDLADPLAVYWRLIGVPRLSGLLPCRLSSLLVATRERLRNCYDHRFSMGVPR